MIKKKEMLTKIAWFLLVVLGSFVVVYLPLFCTGKTFVWAVDGVSQHYSFLKYLSGHSLSELLGGIDLVGAVGTDTLVNYLYYGLFDPFYMIARILPNSWLIASYEIIVILKFLVTALIMFLYLRHKKIEWWTATIFSTVYMLSGYALVMFARHPMLACGMMYLPLLIWGVENLFDHKRPYLFLITNILLLLSNFYMFYMCAIFVVVYALCYVSGTGKKIFSKSSILTYCYIALLYLVTALICAVILLPMMYGFFTSARGENKGFVFPTINVYLQLLLGLFAPVNAQNFYVIGISFIILILLFFGLCEGKDKTYKVLSITMLCALILPFVGYIMNAFNYVSGRWFYLFIFTAVVQSALVIKQYKTSKPTSHSIVRVTKYFSLVVLAIACFGGMVACASLCKKANVGNMVQLLLYIVNLGVGLALGVYVVVSKKLTAYLLKKIDNLAMVKENQLLVVKDNKSTNINENREDVKNKNNAENKNDETNNRKPKKSFQCRLAGLFSIKNVQIAVLVVCLIAGFGYNIYYAKQFRTVDMIHNLTTSKDETYLGSLYQDTFFRVDKSYRATKDYFGNYENNGVVSGYASTYNYNTVSNGYVYEYLKSIGQAGYTHTLGMGGLQGRLAPNAILSTSYYLSYAQDIPYGYEKVEGTDQVLTNTKSLPFGFVYKKILSEKEYLALPYEERANAMLQACVVENGQTDVALESRATKVECLQDCHEVTINGNKIKAGKNASITLTFEAQNNAECVLILKNFRVNHDHDGLDKHIVNVTTPQLQVRKGSAQAVQNLYDKGAQMYHGITNFVFPLGMCEGTNNVTLSMTNGEYSFDDIAIFKYNREQYDSDIAKFNEHLTDLQLGHNEISGTLSTTGGQLFISMPYSKGWTAYVDGVATTIDQCNIGFMGLRVSEGTHKIKLVYHTPYLHQGKLISLVSCVVLLASIVISEIVLLVMKKRRNYEQTK